MNTDDRNYNSMNETKLIRFLFIFAASLLVGSCALNEEVRQPPQFFLPRNTEKRDIVLDSTNKPYSSMETYRLEPPKDDENKTPFSHTTAYIEFDEQGDFLDRGQLKAALADQAVYHASKRLLIFYAHGWQNNTRSRDVALFNQFVAHLNEALAKVDDEQNPPQPRWSVYGVYLAWRGTNFDPVDYVDAHDPSQEIEKPEDIQPKTDYFAWLPVTMVKYFTFWSRKSAAARFAGAPLLETIQSISNKVRAANNQMQTDPLTGSVSGKVLSRTILMGHSFGAYIIEKTLLQSIAAEEGPGSMGSITPPADLVILLNSAAPAIYAKEFIDYLKWHKVGEPKMPFVVSITSEADEATKLAFPAGTIPESLFDVGSYQGSDTYNGANEKTFFTHTPGHCGYLISHDVVPSEEVIQGLDEQFTSDPDAWLLHANLFAGSPREDPKFKSLHIKNNEILLWGDNRYGTSDAESDPQKWAIQAANPNHGYNDTTYWVLRVPKQIISGHGDIWNPNTASLMAGLVRMAGLVPDLSPKDGNLRSLPIHEMAQPTVNTALTLCPPYSPNPKFLH